MPAFNFKSPEGFDWGAFPPVSPEAANWEPDPDSIARPGTIPDARLNRDPYEENRRAAFKKENKSYSIPANAAASMISSSPSPSLQGVNGWPAPEIRASGLPRGFINANNLTTNSVASDRATAASSCNSAALSTSSTSSKYAPMKGAMGTMQIGAQNSGIKASTPTLTHLPSTSSSVPPPMEKTQRVVFAATSIPPHLRKKIQPEKRLDPTAKSYFPTHTAKTASAVVKEDMNMNDTAGDEELARKLATIELGVDDAEEGLQLQKDMMEDYSVNKSKPSVPTPPADSNPQGHRQPGNHGHWLKTRLVIIMEDDLDLSNRATKRELMAMSASDIDQYLQKVASAHEHWWEAEQRLYDHTAKVSE